MGEEENLLAKIGELAGQINRRKNQDASMHHLSSSPSRRPRPSPYGSNRGGPKFQSKSLINHHRVGGDKVNNTTSPIPPDVEVLNGMNSSPRSGCGGIAKSGRGAKTWMSEDSLRRKMKRREKFGAPGSIQSLEKSKAISQLQAKPPTRVSPATRSDDIAVHDTQLQNGERQSQSIVNEHTNMAKVTPTDSLVGGVTIKRPKNDNLVWTELSDSGRLHDRNKPKLCRRYTSIGTVVPPLRFAISAPISTSSLLTTVYLEMTQLPRPSKLCGSEDAEVSWKETCGIANLSDRVLGSCPRGDKCFGIHDINRTAICPAVLRGVDCSAGDDCDRTHESSPQVAPTCMHFLRGNCTRNSCPYSHVSVDPSAPICRSFACLGYCEKGSDCGERHLRECPDYSSAGSCRSKFCPLPHIDRASQMRRIAATDQPGHPDTMNVDSVGNDEKGFGDDDSDCDDTDLHADREEIEEFWGSSRRPSHGLSDQLQDFVALT